MNSEGWLCMLERQGSYESQRVHADPAGFCRACLGPNEGSRDHQHSSPLPTESCRGCPDAVTVLIDEKGAGAKLQLQRPSVGSVLCASQEQRPAAGDGGEGGWQQRYCCTVGIPSGASSVEIS